jgi:hypothetical protein
MRAFLSSTFWDLRAERKAGPEAIKEFGHEVEAMEVFIAKPIEPLKAVLDNLRGCDFMVLLVGSRAGSVVPRRVGLTYTQAEYRLARSLKIPIFLFVKASRGKWRNSEVKGSPKRLSLEKFHAAATRRYLPRHFSSTKELKQQIITALRDWDSNGRPGARRVFSTPQQYFRSQTTGGTLLDYEQTLRGRSIQSNEFERFLEDSGKIIALLKGRGGIGKTKLLRDWSLRLPGWKVLFVNDAAHWHPEAFKEVPDGRVLLIHDDAHRSEILNELSVLTRDLKEKGLVKLVLAFRPSGSRLVEATVSRWFGLDLAFEMTPLEQLSHADVRQVAGEVLGTKFRQYAEALAIVSRDTPLVTVIGGKLIARRQISPSLLANEDVFRRTVFDRFIDEQQGRITSLDFGVRPLLHLLAAVTPIAPSDRRFLERAGNFLQLREDQILKAVDELVKAGVLIKGGSLVRIVPDVLSDFLLEQACTDSSGESVRYAEAIFEQFGEVFLSHLLRNLGELDWRISRRVGSGSILGGIWNTITTRFTAADAFERRQLLESIQPSAIVQPAACLKLVEIAIADEARSTDAHIIHFSYTQKDVLKHLPPILSGMAYDPNYTSVAMQLLWDLAKGERGEKEAARAFKSFASYGRYKSVFYNDAVAEFLNKVMDEPEAFAGEFTPLDLADKLLAKEGDYSELEGMTFHIGTFILDYTVISSTRKKVFAAVEKALFLNSTRAGVRAVQTLEHVISGYLPGLRGAATPRERKWQNRERSVALSLLEKRITTGSNLVPVLRQIRHMLTTFGERGSQDQRYTMRAREIADSIHSDEIDIFDAFVSASWQFDRSDDQGNFISGDSRRQKQVEHALGLIAERCPTPDHKIQELERLYGWLADAGLDGGEHLQFVDVMCKRDPNFCQALADYIVNDNPSDRVAWTLQVVLRNLRKDGEKYKSIATSAADHADVKIIQASAASLFYLDPSDVTEGELELLRRLAPKNDISVRLNVLSGLRWLLKAERFRTHAINVALLVDLGGHVKFADKFCEVFGPYGMGPINLDSAQVTSLLDKLVQVPELDGHNCERLLMQWGDLYPQEIFNFLLRRIEVSAERRAANEWHYHAIPRNISLRMIASSLDLLPNLRLMIDKFIDNKCEPDIGRLFWAVTSLEGSTIEVLEEYLQGQNEAKVTAIIELLKDAPRDIAFNHPRFAARLLDAAEKLGEKYKSYALGRLIINCQPVTIVGGAGSPTLTGIIDRADAFMKEHESDTLLLPLYKHIKDSIVDTIKRLKVDEADLRFGHS